MSRVAGGSVNPQITGPGPVGDAAAAGAASPERLCQDVHVEMDLKAVIFIFQQSLL